VKHQAAKRPVIPADDAKAWRKEARHLRKYLIDITNANLVFMSHLDELMKEPSTYQRGQAISRLMNALEFENDSARHFGLGVSLKGKKRPVKPLALL